MSDTEQRLRDLGFEIVIEDNVRTYRLVQDDRLVLADPRGANKIEFEVTSISKPKKKPQHWRTSDFYMLDSYALNRTAARRRGRLCGFHGLEQMLGLDNSAAEWCAIHPLRDGCG